MTAPDGKPLVLFDNVFPATPSGKIELTSETLAKRWGAGGAAADLARAPRPRYPLTLISPASDKRISSTLGGLAGSREAPPLLMHPHDAAARGLVHGADVRVWNELGEVDPAAAGHRRRAAGRRRQREGRLAGDQPHRPDDLGAGLGRHARPIWPRAPASTTRGWRLAAAPDASPGQRAAAHQDIRRPRARTGGLRGSPRPPGTGRAACRRRRRSLSTEVW